MNLKDCFELEVAKVELDERLKRKRSYECKSIRSVVEIDDFSTKDSLKNDSLGKF